MKVKIGSKTYRDIRNLKFSPQVDVTGSSIITNEFSVEILTNDRFDIGTNAGLFTDGGGMICQYFKLTNIERVNDRYVSIKAQSRVADLEKSILSPRWCDGTDIRVIASECGATCNSAILIWGTYFPEQTAKERLQWLCVTYGFFVTDQDGVKMTASGKTITHKADDVYYLPEYKKNPEPVKVRVTAYHYEEGTPTETDEWVKIGDRYYIVTKQVLESSQQEDVRTVDVSGVGSITTGLASGVMSRLAGYFYNQDEVTASVKASDLDESTIVYPGDYARIYYRENKMYEGRIVSADYSDGGLYIKRTMTIVKPSSITMYPVTISCQYTNQGRRKILDTQRFYFPAYQRYTITLRDYIVENRGLLYYYEPIEREITGITYPNTNRVVEYRIARIDGDDTSSLYAIADNGKYPRKFVESVNRARAGSTTEAVWLGKLGITDFSKTYYELYQEALAAYDLLPDTEEKAQIYEHFFTGDTIWAVDGGTWTSGTKNYWEFDEEGNLKFPTKFAGTLERARRGDADAVEVFSKLGLTRDDLNTMTDDEVYEYWRSSYLSYEKGGYDDDITYIYSQMGVNPDDLSPSELHTVWTNAFSELADDNICDVAYHIYARAGYTKEQIDGMTSEERLAVWESAYSMFVNPANRGDYAEYFYDEWSNRKNVKNLINATKIEIEYNGYYEAETAFSEVSCKPRPRLKERTFNANGYYFRDDDIEGYSKVTVNVDKNALMRDIVISSAGEYRPEEPYEAFNQVNVNLPYFEENCYKFGKRLYDGAIVKAFSNGKDIYTIEYRVDEWNDDPEYHYPIIVSLPIKKNGEDFAYLYHRLNLENNDFIRYSVQDILQRNVEIFTINSIEYICFGSAREYNDGGYISYVLCSVYAPLIENTIVSQNGVSYSVYEFVEDLAVKLPQITTCIFQYRKECVIDGRPAFVGTAETNDSKGIIVVMLDDKSMSYYPVQGAVDISIPTYLPGMLIDAPTITYHGDLYFLLQNQIQAGQGLQTIVETYLMKYSNGQLTMECSDVTENFDWQNSQLTYPTPYEVIPNSNLGVINDKIVLTGLSQAEQNFESKMFEGYSYSYGNVSQHIYELNNGHFVDRGIWQIDGKEVGTGFVTGKEDVAICTSIPALCGGGAPSDVDYYLPMTNKDGLYEIKNKPIKRYEVS